MKKPKVVVLTSQVLSERDYKRFAINTIENKSQLTVLDFTYILQPRIFEEQLNSRKQDLQTIFIKNLSQLNNLKIFFDESDLIFSILGNQNELNDSIFRFVKPYERKICLVNISALPLRPYNLKFFVFRKLYCGIFSENKFFLKNKFKKTIFLIKKVFSKNIILKPGYFAACGDEVIKNMSNSLDKETNIIKTCSYDFVLSKLVKKRLLNYKYFVFLDENIVNHSDFKILNKSVEKEDIYYSELNKLFSFIETNFNTKVVIATHPRADLEYNKKKFPKYNVFIGITPQLMKYSEGCITHASTSINFAVIFDKPILFITTDRMKKRRYANELLSSWFNKKPLNISKSYNYRKIISSIKIKKKYVKQYFNKFISFSEDIEFGFGSLIDSLKN